VENPTPPDSFAPAPVPPPAETPAVEPAPVRASWLRWTWRWFKTGVVVLFVCWQLFFLFVRNPLDFWYAPFKEWCQKEKIWDADDDPRYGVKPLLDPVDDTTLHYGNFAGIDQNWRMFTSPLARYDYFLAARIEFVEGGDEVIRSENEVDPRGYFRFGGWRQRKLEDYLVTNKSELWPGNDELPIWEAYARWSVRRWRERFPDDTRTPAHVVLIRRDFNFPKPTEDPAAFAEPEVYTIGTFLPDGRLVP
jgi:hypothetical protein